MSRKSFVPIIAAGVALTLVGLTQLLAQVSPDSSEARQAKSARYGGGRCDITTKAEDHECFFEQYEPAALPLIPMKQSTIAFVGQVTDVKPYLSADRTHIYAETTFRVEELLKSAENFRLPSDQTLIADQLGGSMKLPSGRLIHDNTRSGYMGKPRVGGRYVLFLKVIHEGKDLEILRAYELRDGKVFKVTEDGSPSNVLLSRTPNKPDSFSDEQELLQAIRKHDSVDPKTGKLRLTIPATTTRGLTCTTAKHLTHLSSTSSPAKNATPSRAWTILGRVTMRPKTGARRTSAKKLRTTEEGPIRIDLSFLVLYRGV